MNLSFLKQFSTYKSIGKFAIRNRHPIGVLASASVGAAVAGEDNRLMGAAIGAGAYYGGRGMLRGISKSRKMVPKAIDEFSDQMNYVRGGDWGDAAATYFGRGASNIKNSPFVGSFNQGGGTMGLLGGLWGQVRKAPIGTSIGGAIGGFIGAGNPLAIGAGAALGNIIMHPNNWAGKVAVAAGLGTGYQTYRSISNRVTHRGYQSNMYNSQSSTGRYRGNLGADGDLALGLYNLRHGA